MNNFQEWVLILSTGILIGLVILSLYLMAKIGYLEALIEHIQRDTFDIQRKTFDILRKQDREK